MGIAWYVVVITSNSVSFYLTALALWLSSAAATAFDFYLLGFGMMAAIKVEGN